MNNFQKVIAVILANGSSSRTTQDKLIVKITDKNILEITIQQFIDHSDIDEVIIVRDGYDFTHEKLRCISGGKTRFESLNKAIVYLSQQNISHNTKILVHNGANPLVSKEEITYVIDNIKGDNAVGLAHPIYATLRRKTKDKTHIINRENMYAMQTPQGSYFQNFEKGIAMWNEKYEPTDELMLFENIDLNIEILEACDQNFKITTDRDIKKLKRLYIPQLITGMGIDSHRFIEGGDKPCVLCGVELEDEKGFEANSDGDIALHSLCNAFLSAIGEGSFSSIADPMCKKRITDSQEYLKVVLEKLEKKGYIPQKITLCFEGKYPKVEKYFSHFQKNLSMLCNISLDMIGLNAMSGEEIDGYGQGKGMKVTSFVQVCRK